MKLSQHPVCESGTLVIVIPTNRGLVVVADGLSTVDGRPKPSRASKIGLVKGRVDLAFALTGTFIWLPGMPPGYDAVEWARINEPIFSGRDIVGSQLSELSFGVLSSEVVGTISRTLSSEINSFLEQFPDLRAQFINKNLCRLVVTQFSGDDQIARIGTSLFAADEFGRIQVTKVEAHEAHQDDERLILKYGESDYVDSNVLAPGSIGQSFLRRDLSTLWNTPIFIREMSPESAAKISTSLIEATEKTSEIVLISTYVGGAPSLVLLDGQSLPKQLDKDGAVTADLA